MSKPLVVDQLAATLAEDDLSRVSDFVSASLERVIDGPSCPDIKELWERRMATQTLRRAIKGILSTNTQPQIAEAWQGQLVELDILMLENFTRQADGDIAVIPTHGVKYGEYATPNDGCERRNYLGLHTHPFDNDGLSSVVAFKPTLHEQPYHAHRKTDENSLALHPTTGLAMPKFGAEAIIHSLAPGQMVHFSKFTPHTLKNPTHFMSADASVKMPEALGDRAPLTHQTIGSFLHEHSDKHRSGSIVTPAHDETQTNGVYTTGYEITDCGKTYRVDFMNIPAGVTSHNFDINGIADGSRALLSVFPEQGKKSAALTIGGDMSESVDVKFGEWVVLSDHFADGLSLSNTGAGNAIVYCAREI